MKKTVLFMVLCTIVSIFGCSCNSSKIKMADSTVVEILDGYWSPAISAISPRDGGLVRCGSDEDNYVFEVHARHGSFLVGWDDGNLRATDIVIEGSGNVFWQCNNVSYPEFSSLIWSGVKTFLEVLIKKDDQYVGYAVVAVEYEEEKGYYCATIVECKEVLEQENSADELSRRTLQQMIDDVIQKY